MTLDRFFSGMVFCLAIILLSSGCGKGDEKSLDLETLRLSLDEGWEFSTIDSSNWLPAEIPGVVHADLIRNHQIPNPYFRLNEMEVQWVEYQTWVYRCTFHVHEELLRREKVSLVLPGLDSHADISLNGKPVPFPGDPDFRKNTPRNMFRTWTYEVKSYLNPGENQIEITFHPLIQSTQVARDTLGYALPADNDASEEKASIFVRKAPYHFGWDWGPRLVTAGIWKTPYLEAWDGTEILDWSFVTKSITTDAAEAELEVHIQAKRPGNFSLEGSIGEQVIDRRLALSADPMRVRIPLTIQDPQLWWPQGSGEPYLYPLNLKLKKGYRVLDEIQAQIGIRTVELIRETDEIGESFYFEVNGEPIYMKGANYIPGDPLLLGKDDERYRQVLLDAAKSNMNMIRVWGGGIYETDGFYDLCDSLGLMVWQDFMFACSMYPGDPEFRENVKAEAEENIIRIRNHPSLALWCGNNEMEVAWFNWGWQQTYKLTPEDSTRIWNDYLYLFEELLPTAVRTFDPNTDYLPSSPVSNWGKAENFNYGDNHYWGVWHGEEPFAEYRYNVPRFMSEYGFQSFPEIHTLLIFSTWDDFDLESEVMTDRQKSYKGNGLLMDYLNRHFDPPADFEEFVHLNQLVQAEGVALAIKTHRKRKPHCMGTLYWQLNDAWPGPSWSGIDYAGRWKAMQYRVRDLYKPVVILPDMDSRRTYECPSGFRSEGSSRTGLGDQVTEFCGN